MSNSIWKTPGFHEAIDNKLKVSKDGKWIYWTMYGWNIPGEDVHDIGVEWAYLEDVLAQADKAERLQNQNSVLLNYLMDFMHREKEYVAQYKTAKSVSTINGYHKRIKDHLHEIGIDD